LSIALDASSQPRETEPVSELFESAGGILVLIVIVALVLWALYSVFGSQAFGLPSLIGVFVVLAVGRAMPSLGILTLGAIVLGLLVLFIVVGTAMSLGPEELPKAHDEKPKEE
jgi:hypothetical protein